MNIIIRRDAFYVDRDRRVCEAYKSGAGIEELRQRFGIEYKTIMHILNDGGEKKVQHQARW